MTKKNLAAVILCAAGALALAGCTSTVQKLDELQKSYERNVKIEPVVGSIWRITAEREKVESPARIAEYAYERAKNFCSDKGLGMLPLTGSSTGAKEDGTPAKAWLEFRCSNPEKVEREYKGITLHFDDLLEDEKKR